MARLFRGLRRDPDPRYDVVVIGAGIGGLVCANILARSGVRVLLTEQHYMAGGYCSTFRRKGYTFDAGTHFYPLLGNESTITGKLLRSLGCRTRWAKMDPVDHFHLPDGSEFFVPADFPVYLARLKSWFPDEATAIDRFFEMTREAYLSGLLYHFRGRDTERRARFAGLTVRSVLDECFKDERLKLILCGDCGHWGAPPSRTAFVFDSMLRLAYFLGNYYPVGGSQAFADGLAAGFEENGGHVLMSSDVKKIVAARDTAHGVEIETGFGRSRHRVAVASDCVVSNADLRHTLDLIGPGVLPAAYVRTIHEMRHSSPCFLVHIGLRGISTETLRAVDGYHWTSWNPDHVGSDAFKIFVPTLYEPAMAPEGGHIIIVQKLTNVRYERVQDWQAHKRYVEGYLLGNLDRIMPGFSRHIVVHTSATAQTSWRFTRNHSGSMLGWELAPDQVGHIRPGLKTPVRNLYLTGHWSIPGGGITPVIISAQMAAQKVITAREPQMHNNELPFATAPSRETTAGGHYA